MIARNDVMHSAAVKAGVDLGDFVGEEERIEPLDDRSGINRAELGSILLTVLEQSDTPRTFFDELSELGVLDTVYPPIGALRGVPAGPPGTHKEGDAYEHTMLVLEKMNEQHPNNVEALAAALAHDFGKGKTPEDDLPGHPGHAKRGAEMAAEEAHRLEIDRVEGAMTVGACHHMKFHDIFRINPTTMLDIAKDLVDVGLGAEEFVNLGWADAKGRRPPTEFEYARISARVKPALDVVEAIDADTALDRRGSDPGDYTDAQIASMVRQDRAEALRERWSEE